jgi:hypothetical protein
VTLRAAQELLRVANGRPVMVRSNQKSGSHHKGRARLVDVRCGLLVIKPARHRGVTVMKPCDVTPWWSKLPEDLRLIAERKL